MEYKITNYDVITENVLLEQTAELPIEADITLADYEPDIKKILKCEIKSYISSKRISGNALGIEGVAIVCIIYSDNNESVFSVQTEIPFKKLFESNSILDNGNCHIVADCSTHSCRAVTERKLSVRGSVKLDTTVISAKKKPIISDIDGENFEILCGETEAITPMCITEKNFVIDEELILNDSLPSAKKIIHSFTTPLITECKIINNKVIIKGTLVVDAFYLSNDDTGCNFKTELPFNQIIDLVGVGEDCECDAGVFVCGFNLSTRTAQSGECRSFALVCKLTINVTARCESKIPVIFDIYSTKYFIKPKKEEVCFNKIVHKSREKFSCKKTISMIDGSYSKISSLWCQSGNCISRFDTEGIKLLGTITVCILASDENGEPTYFERIIDYEYPINIKETLTNPVCRISAEILNSDYKTDVENNIELILELQLSATVYDINNVSLITEMEIDEENTVKGDNASVIVYFADKEERIWDISKHFSAERKKLTEINDIKEEIISNPRILLIPKF